jgi:DNA polymerase-3 subunit delta
MLHKVSARLARGLEPLYVVAGNEPLLADEVLGLIREVARRAGCDERELHVAERSFDWDAFAVGLRNFSLFAIRRLIELRLPTGKPGDSGARFLTALAAESDPGNVIVIVLPGLDATTARAKWATALAESAVWIDVRTPQPEQLPAWLRGRARQANLTLDDEAIETLAARVEGNLLAAKQELDKLALLTSGERISAADVESTVADGARFDVYQLSAAALSGDTGRAVRVLHGLEREGVPMVLALWSLVRDVLTLTDIVLRTAQGGSLDQALTEARVWRSRQDLFREAASRWAADDVIRLIRAAARAEQIIKGARCGRPTNALLELTLALASPRHVLAEIA